MKFDTAQICLNGHSITEYARTRPESTERFCHRCGQKTIMACPSCNEALLGGDPGYGYSTDYVPPYCPNCGEPYPWTARALTAARELINEQEILSIEDKDALTKSLDDLIADNPKTVLVATRVKKLLAKTTPAAVKLLKETLYTITAEAAKKVLWPDSR